MGSFCSKTFDEREPEPIDEKVEEVRDCLSALLRQLGPNELLTFAIEDEEIYEVCKENGDLRQACIIAAVRRYHTEKFFYEDVYNRTADYMIMLDTFLQIQDEIELREFEKTRIKYLPCFYKRNEDREGDAAKNGEDD